MSTDINRAEDLIMQSMRQVGVDPDSGEFDADVIETGRSKSQRDRRKVLEGVVQKKEDDYDKGALVSEILQVMVEEGFNASKVEHDLGVFEQEEGKIDYTDDQRNYIRYLD